MKLVQLLCNKSRSCKKLLQRADLESVDAGLNLRAFSSNPGLTPPTRLPKSQAPQARRLLALLARATGRHSLVRPAPQTRAPDAPKTRLSVESARVRRRKRQQAGFHVFGFFCCGSPPVEHVFRFFFVVFCWFSFMFSRELKQAKK